MGLSGCRAPGGGNDAGPAKGDRAAVVSALTSCVEGRISSFERAAAGLAQASASWVQVGDAQRAAARTAFITAFDEWQALEQLQVGPAASSTQPGGADLRDPIYAWPLFSACAVDEVIVAQGYADVPRLLVNRRGLAAVEALLWADGDATSCAATSAIVTSGSWAALSSTERSARRRAYASAVAADVSARAQALGNAWRSAFGDSLRQAGPGRTPFTSPQAALNALSDGAFYVDSVMKDLKLAPALGLRECASPPCLDRLEARPSGRSKAAIVANVAGLEELLLGCAAGGGRGFDDLLGEVGAQSVATRLVQALGDVKGKLTAIPGDDLAVALQQNAASVQALYDSIKALTTILKGDFVMVLDVALPQALEGDND